MLVVERLFKSFGTVDPPKYVLQDITFTVQSGEFLCILGPSGCGKTTLLRCVGGFETYDRGQISINGNAIAGPGIDRMMVFQQFDQLFSWKTAQGNVAYPLLIQGVPRPQAWLTAGQYLELVGLQDYKHYYPHQLSGGMKQRIALARALVLKPRILLMDEPFGNLDAQTRHILQNELLRLWADLQTTVLFVTHDIEEALLLADRILMLGPGGIIKNITTNPLPRPRTPAASGFSDLWDQLYAQLGQY